jgi:hypothetical protein
LYTGLYSKILFKIAAFHCEPENKRESAESLNNLIKTYLEIVPGFCVGWNTQNIHEVESVTVGNMTVLVDSLKLMYQQGISAYERLVENTYRNANQLKAILPWFAFSSIFIRFSLEKIDTRLSEDKEMTENMVQTYQFIQSEFQRCEEQLCKKG